MRTKTKLELNEVELHQTGVANILTYFDERLVELRILNDNYKADRSTRGRIAEIKTIQKSVKKI